ncbi:hypothetical protein D9M68_982580 [compost metagenome]
MITAGRLVLATPISLKGASGNTLGAGGALLVVAPGEVVVAGEVVPGGTEAQPANSNTEATSV